MVLNCLLTRYCSSPCAGYQRVQSGMSLGKWLLKKGIFSIADFLLIFFLLIYPVENIIPYDLVGCDWLAKNLVCKFKLFQVLCNWKSPGVQEYLLLTHTIALREKMQSKGICGKALLNMGKYSECVNNQFITIWFWDRKNYWEDGIWASCLGRKKFSLRTKICV